MPNKFAKQREKAQSEVSVLHKKFVRSRGVFIILNVLLILMSAFMGILSAYSIAKNGHLPSVAIFIAIAFITAFIAFFNALMATLSLNNRFETSKSKIEKLQFQLEQLKKNEVTDIKEFLSDIASANILDQ